jgi:hypothetical protein
VISEMLKYAREGDIRREGEAKYEIECEVCETVKYVRECEVCERRKSMKENVKYVRG